MADSIWSHLGDKIIQLFEEDDELKDFSFTIVGHSLGAGAACLLNIKCYKENLFGARTVKCYGFVPPPTLCTDHLKDDSKLPHPFKRSLTILSVIFTTMTVFHFSRLCALGG